MTRFSKLTFVDGKPVETDVRDSGGSVMTPFKMPPAFSRHGDFTQRKRVVCADGFSMSVQAGGTHYCSPRAVVPDDKYTTVEVGYPSAREELLMPYVEDADAPTETVYGYVPVEVVKEVVAKHGGLKDGDAA